ncbi:hypothetical protein AFULGI_00006140 [Archaeoglobus fulgidus DSM 8774]|uniref:Uncharacterized protein n=1 Tax=Archaeoglobus fulgidus DSM 8774 TaxID=1344584 RepID=A0A075WAJ9_ARCFL|nr:hypothetical protein [Archaeoglobus fulgidus]AIG97415.1 hypothetical protein AFULGI_00006140 [Archaeoglobus fulgidus DSM 8774]
MLRGSEDTLSGITGGDIAEEENVVSEGAGVLGTAGELAERYGLTSGENVGEDEYGKVSITDDIARIEGDVVSRKPSKY